MAETADKLVALAIKTRNEAFEAEKKAEYWGDRHERLWDAFNKLRSRLEKFDVFVDEEEDDHIIYYWPDADDLSTRRKLG